MPFRLLQNLHTLRVTFHAVKFYPSLKKLEPKTPAEAGSGVRRRCTQWLPSKEWSVGGERTVTRWWRNPANTTSARRSRLASSILSHSDSRYPPTIHWEQHSTSEIFLPKPIPQSNHENNIQDTPTEGHSTKYLMKLFSKLSMSWKTREVWEAYRDQITKCSVVSCMESWNRKRTLGKS